MHNRILLVKYGNLEIFGVILRKTKFYGEWDIINEFTKKGKTNITTKMDGRCDPLTHCGDTHLNIILHPPSLTYILPYTHCQGLNMALP